MKYSIIIAILAQIILITLKLQESIGWDWLMTLLPLWATIYFFAAFKLIKYSVKSIIKLIEDFNRN